ncbi:HlyD family efflux transporter periplasmic adaptor subunit [Parashewanella spongiae]|uniref:HlyD family efflux transporter periplasmic adaptor subunit n=1 Tax=Parashewanella spongiae TaxID=342950 RepID=A0A3A6UCI6_9GAMM|nr:HlyD family efflux transporter periplasmic adaptor subunit [Parashewanella spongiae]MCL1077196.1 HlyD family efflux transporter periplasmic adaptor subunit [Parashewanella spongiae]RJY19351.1 HlyD family efflux transporter periplasmic adaptor subunit [Parashewanella spongiae]
MKYFSICWLLLPIALASCSGDSSQQVLTVTVTESDFSIIIPAVGELEAQHSTLVSVPNSLRGPQSIAWLQDNFSVVKKGDVVARLDPAREQFKLTKETLDNRRLTLDGNIQKESDLTLRKSLTLDKQVTSDEQQLAKQFYSEDEQVYTKIDIIDQMRNQEYLSAKMDYFDWNVGQHDIQANAEQDLINLKKKGHQSKINRYQHNLSKMEILAPNDGLFVYKPSWNGIDPVVGDMVWSGMAIGLLPDTSKMQATLYVLESEALGLEVGKQAKVFLDAYPNRPFVGTVSQIDALAQPKDHNSPVNYFHITVQLEQTIPKIMQPGRQVNAEIIALKKHNVLTVPNQSLFQKEGQYWVYMKTPAGFIKQTIILGKRSLNRTEIIEGLKSGDVVSLTVPPAGSQV